MKQLLGALGLGALVCLPCLLLAGAAGIAAGGAPLALVNEPLVKGAGLAIVVVSAGLAWRRWPQRACEIGGGVPQASAGAPGARLPLLASMDDKRKETLTVAGETLSLRIQGMTCADCAETVERALAGERGVVSARVSWPLGSADVAYDPELTSENAILAAPVFTRAQGQHRFRARRLLGGSGCCD